MTNISNDVPTEPTIDIADFRESIVTDDTIALIVAHQTTTDRAEYSALGREINHRSATDRLAEAYSDALTAHQTPMVDYSL